MEKITIAATPEMWQAVQAAVTASHTFFTEMLAIEPTPDRIERVERLDAFNSKLYAALVERSVPKSIQQEVEAAGMA